MLLRIFPAFLERYCMCRNFHFERKRNLFYGRVAISLSSHCFQQCCRKLIIESYRNQSGQFYTDFMILENLCINILYPSTECRTFVRFLDTK